MKVGKIDWNDPMSEFIRVKLHKPEVLTELIRREKQYAEKKSTEHKMEALRGRYQDLSLKFRNEQQEYERKVQIKRQLQKDVIRICNAIKKMQVELEKLMNQQVVLQFRHSGQTEKEQPTRYSVNSDQFSIKKHQEQLASIMSDQGSLKQSLHKQVQKLIAKRVALTEDLQNSTVKLQRMIYKKQLRQKYEERREVLQQTKLLVQQQQRKRKSLLYTLSEQDERNQNLRHSRQSFQDNIQKSNKRIQNFMKESKKILMNEDNRHTKKYKQFIKKYRLYSKQEQQELRTSLTRIFSRGDADLRLSSLSSSSSPQRKKQSYEDLVVQVLKKFGSRSFTSDEFTSLQNNCLQISMYHSHLSEEHTSLDNEVESLRQNLQRKSRQLKEMKKSPMYKFQSL